MKVLRKKLALLLIFCMVFSIMPTTALAETSADAGANRVYADRADTVIYNLGDYEVSVGLNEEKVDYVFAPDGSFVIEVEENAFFPYEVQFKSEGQMQELWFDTPESTVQFAGHTFGVHSAITADATLTQLGFVINGEYVAAKPEPKEFSNDGGFSTFSLFPLEERLLELDLRTFWPFELKNMGISAVVEGADSTATAAWGIAGTESYEIVKPGATIDLTKFNSYSSTDTLEFIVGTAKQLDKENIRYIVDIRNVSSYPYDIFNAAMYNVQGTERTPIEVYETRLYDYISNTKEYDAVLNLSVANVEAVGENYLALKLADAYAASGISVKAYAGEFTTVEQAAASNAEISAQLFDDSQGYKLNNSQTEQSGSSNQIYDKSQDYKGSNKQDKQFITFVFYQNGAAMAALPVQLEVSMTSNYLSGCLQADNSMDSSGYNIAYNPEDGRPGKRYSANVYLSQNTEDKDFVLNLYKEYPANAEYVFVLRYYYKAESNYKDYGLSHISKAVVGGYYNDLSAAAALPDIKNDLFSYAGYKANYSGEGQKFTVFTNEGEVYQFSVKAVDGAEYSRENRLSSGHMHDESKTHYFSYDEVSENEIPVYTFRMEDQNSYPYRLLPSDTKCYAKLVYNYHSLNGESSLPYVTKAVQGHFETLAAAEGQGDIKAALFGDGFLACYQTPVEFTVFDTDGNVFHLKIKTVGRSTDNYVIATRILDAGDSGITSDRKTQIDKETGARSTVFTLYKDMPANAEYNVALMYFIAGQGSTANITHLVKAVQGNYATLEAAKNQADIKDELFDYSVGYKAVYDKGVEFTIFGDENQVYHATVKVETGNEERPGFSDTDLDVDGAYGVYDEYGNSYISSEKIYKVESKDDNLASVGYQALLIEDETLDLSTLRPTFRSPFEAKVFAPDSSGNNVVQESGETTVDFTNSPVQYTVTSQNGKVQRNYWVIFVKKVAGPKLFVIRTNDKEEGTGNDLRELFIDDFKHDVLVANIGDSELTGINTELTEAQNVKLDDYWQIGGAGNDTLGAFELTNQSYYSSDAEQWNLGKVRLLPRGFGKVSGYLTISAPGQETVKIKLTGDVTAPKFTRAEIPQAVKYVPYAALIQTDNKYAWNMVTFEVNGNLPKGVELRPSGELYGVPTEAGEFKFTVTAVSSNELFTDKSVSQEFTLTVLDNTDENVANFTDSEDGYGIEKRVEDKYVSQIVEQDFISEGEYAQFADFWLDGNKLVEGVDYESEEGSTKITIRSETFKKYSTAGRHTIAAEFRKPNTEGSNIESDLRKTAQNYEIKVQSSGGSSHRPSGGSGGGGTKPTQPTKPEQPTKPVEPQQPEQSTEPVMNFTDVSPEGWFYNEVLWVFTEKLMQGNGDGTFGPNNPTSPAALVTVLARLSGADLTTYANESYADVIENKWYSDYAKWAKGNGLLGEMAFDADSAISRNSIAQILLKYLQALGVELPQVEQPQQFADAEQMTAEENANFQILYALGIFQGNGDNSMNPQGATTRAELAALLQRVSNVLTADLGIANE